MHLVAFAFSLREIAPCHKGFIDWELCAHVSAMQLWEDGSRNDALEKPLRLLIPTRYFQRVGPGPARKIKLGHDGDIGLFTPDQPAPADAMSRSELMDALQDFWVPSDE